MFNTAITEAILKLQPQEGHFLTPIDGVWTVYRTTPVKRNPELYQPSLIFISSGAKNLCLNEKTYSYGCGSFLLVASPIPIVCEAIVKPGEAFSGVIIPLDRTKLLSLIKTIKKNYTPKPRELSPGIIPLPLSEEIECELSHLLKVAQDPQDSQMLGESIIREILYYAIKSDQANEFCDIVLGNKNYQKFGDILEEINENYSSSFSMQALAESVNLSSASFFRQFKAFTGYPPNQYIKDVRLNKAKSLITRQGYGIQQAAKKVGYNSLSQFSREYKRYFGCTPTAEIGSLS